MLKEDLSTNFPIEINEAGAINPEHLELAARSIPEEVLKNPDFSKFTNGISPEFLLQHPTIAGIAVTNILLLAFIAASVVGGIRLAWNKVIKLKSWK